MDIFLGEADWFFIIGRGDSGGIFWNKKKWFNIVLDISLLNKCRNISYWYNLMYMYFFDDIFFFKIINFYIIIKEFIKNFFIYSLSFKFLSI